MLVHTSGYIPAVPMYRPKQRSHSELQQWAGKDIWSSLDRHGPLKTNCKHNCCNTNLTSCYQNAVHSRECVHEIVGFINDDAVTLQLNTQGGSTGWVEEKLIRQHYKLKKEHMATQLQAENKMQWHKHKHIMPYLTEQNPSSAKHSPFTTTDEHYH